MVRKIVITAETIHHRLQLPDIRNEIWTAACTGPRNRHRTRLPRENGIRSCLGGIIHHGSPGGTRAAAKSPSAPARVVRIVDRMTRRIEIAGSACFRNFSKVPIPDAERGTSIEPPIICQWAGNIIPDQATKIRTATHAADSVGIRNA